MSEVAPGTFQHSLQLANLTAAAANRIGANSQLVRTGAMYHDIGKMMNPAFFTENQSGVNPHDQLNYYQSAQIVINHVIDGLKLADKYNLPQVIKDFISTHHGKGLTKYFYISYQNEHPDEEVDKELNQSRERQARYVEVERESKDGDYVVIDFTGYTDNKAFEGGAAQDYRLKLGSHTFIEGFEDQLVGLKKGDKKDVKVTFPVDYFSEDLKGKDAIFDVTVKKVEEKTLPPLDDEFASNVSEFETLADYKADIRKHLEENLQARLKREDENNIIETIVKSSEVEIPDVLVERQLDSFIEDFSMRLSYQGYKLEDYLKQANVTEEELREERREQAKDVVKTRLVLETIVKQEKLDVTDKELDEKLAETAQKYGKTLEEYKKNLGDRNIAYIQNDILMQKLLSLLTNSNTLN